MFVTLTSELSPAVDEVVVHAPGLVYDDGVTPEQQETGTTFGLAVPPVTHFVVV